MAHTPLATTLTYMADTDERPVFHASAGASGTNQYEGHFEDYPVSIMDGRDDPGRFTLDTHGFQLVSHRSAVTDFYDETRIETHYEPEVRRLIRDLTGAVRVHVFDHTFRTDSATIRSEKGVRDPVPLVHNDYTERSARQRVRDLLPAADVEALLAQRFAILNVWRSVGGTVETTPLAMCDARSINADNLIAMERRAKDRVGEMQQVTYDAGHRWYYFPRMDQSEALVFKTYDAVTDGRAQRSLHSAFSNPAAPATAAPRESLETRVFAFFEE